MLGHIYTVYYKHRKAYANTFLHTFLYTYACAYIYTRTYIHKRTQTYIHKRTTNVHKRIYTNVILCMHTWTHGHIKCRTIIENVWLHRSSFVYIALPQISYYKECTHKT